MLMSISCSVIVLYWLLLVKLAQLLAAFFISFHSWYLLVENMIKFSHVWSAGSVTCQSFRSVLNMMVLESFLAMLISCASIKVLIMQCPKHWLFLICPLILAKFLECRSHYIFIVVSFCGCHVNWINYGIAGNCQILQEMSCWSWSGISFNILYPFPTDYLCEYHNMCCIDVLVVFAYLSPCCHANDALRVSAWR